MERRTDRVYNLQTVFYILQIATRVCEQNKRMRVQNRVCANKKTRVCEQNERTVYTFDRLCLHLTDRVYILQTVFTFYRPCIHFTDRVYILKTVSRVRDQNERMRRQNAYKHSRLQFKYNRENGEVK